MPTITAKRGTTFRHRFTLSPASLDGASLAAQVRRGGFAADLAVRVLDHAPGEVEISATPEATADWPAALLACDVRAVLPGGAEAFATATFHIDMQAQVTHG